MSYNTRNLTTILAVVLLGLLFLTLLAQSAGFSLSDMTPTGDETDETKDTDDRQNSDTGSNDNPTGDEQSASTDEEPADSDSTDKEPADSDSTDEEPADNDSTDDGIGIGGPPAQMVDTLTSKPEASFFTTFDADSFTNWSVEGEGADSGGASLVDGTLRLHVDQCYTTTVQRKVGTYDGKIRVSFEWVSVAQQWWERPGWRLLGPDGTEYNYTVTRGSDVGHPEKASIRTNVTVATAAVDGPVFLEYRITPSQYCHRANHAITALYVDTLAVERVTD